ncbi:coronin-7 isoform X1 [Anopheles gambiae]|uniref:coronin-7 isoform X1 n=1 Tax=Anopheles gambiae TaxID=7165 RepID=UPI002AC8BEF9|nr:coronin-7 isoform X1 [Anopheles gambiae]
MAWRFKASKYKNAAPIVPKPEACIRDIFVGSYQTYGNNIAASAAFIAFNWEHAGSSLAVLPIDDCGRKSKTMPLLHAHSDTVTYLDFSPFHDGLLATGSQDCLVKVWHIPEKGLEQSLSTPECTFTTKQRRVETVGFHPTADCLLYATAVGWVSLWDLTTQQEAFSNNEHPEVIQSLSWKQDGRLCVTSCKDKMVRVLDPRASAPITLAAESHQSIKDSRVVWLGEQNRILSTGFDAARLRQVIIRDLRNFSVPEKTLELDCSTGILMPLYDPDTNMLFLSGKGDTTINYLEVTDKDPYLIEGIRHSGEQTKGACLVPKRALKVMEGEVNRIMQLTSNSVIPIMYQVPRKTYRDFHNDLYPDTNGYKSEMTATQWLNGANTPVPKISLDPAKREHGDAPIIVLRGPLTEVVNNIANKMRSAQSPNNISTAAKIEREPYVKPTFVPIKEKIKHMEQQSHTEKCELEQRFKEISAVHKERDEEGNGTPLTVENNGNGNHHPHHHPQQQQRETSCSSFDSETDGGRVAGETTPPKPLPRTSRNNSVSEQLAGTAGSVGSGEDVSPPGPVAAPAGATNVPRPVARPRTTSGYKPRLGPKPFCSTGSSGDFSFEKVFNVPAVPGAEPGSDKESAALPGPTVGDSSAPAEKNGNTLTVSPEPDEPKDDSPTEPGKPEPAEPMDQCDVETRTIPHAELRKPGEQEKIFERQASSESVDQFDATADDAKGQFERLSAQRTSLAERRRMFESRSQSVQDGEKASSPTPLRRRESLKVRGEQKSCADDTDLMPPPPATDFLRNRSDLSKENMPDIVKRSNSTAGVSTVASSNNASANNNNNNVASKRTSTVFGRVSKFRHLKGTPGHKSTHIENIRNLSRQIPGECDGFAANAARVAVPIAGAGGKIAVLELNDPGRLPDGVIPTLVNIQNIMDFQWDPFDASRLAVACDDGSVKLWRIPAGGLTEPTNEPEAVLVAHADKLYTLRFHPLAQNVLLTASVDMVMKVWDLGTMEEKCTLYGHTDQIFCFSWSPCGRYGATVSKDGRIRVYEPRQSSQPIGEGTGPVGTRGARVLWALEGDYLVVTGFDKVSERQIYVYKVTDLSAPMGMVGLDVSPAILMPYYDEDSSTLFATGKGDSTIYCFEITDEAPFICPLSHHRCTNLTQGLSFLAKNQCDVAAVEFARALRLTNGTVEPLSFTVPRLKVELFQDDLFPPTRVLWQPTLTAAEWFAGRDVAAARISMKPDGMDTLSSIQPTVTTTPSKKSDTVLMTQGIHKPFAKAPEHVQEQIKNAVSARMSVNKKLEQDSMEGVDEKEWEE